MLSRNTGQSCKCGATQAKLGQHWLRHTSSCPHWITDHAHLFAPAPVDALPSMPMPTPTMMDDSASSAANQELITLSVPFNITSAPTPGSLPRLNELIRQTRRPRPIADILPAPAQPPTNVIPDVDEPNQQVGSGAPAQQRTVRLLIWHETPADIFGVYRKYRHPSTSAPSVPAADTRTLHTSDIVLDNDALALAIQNIIHPFPNLTTFRLAYWFYTGSPSKSLSERDRLVNSVILAPGFSAEHLSTTNLKSLDKALDQLTDENEEDLLGIHSSDDWATKDVYISLPQAPSRARRNISTTRSDTYSEFGHQVCIPGFRHRNLVKVIIAQFTSPANSSFSFHYVPFRKYWRPNSNLPEERIYDELYTSDTWLEEHAAVQRLPAVDGCTRERAIAALMFSSDETHLAQLGNTSLWPVYLTFGNISKYDRCKVSNQLMQHIAYLVKPGSAVKTQIELLTGNKAISNTFAPLIKREVVHESWKHLLDVEFVKAYQDGIPIACADGVDRRIYPRIFTYSADYPERVVMAGIRDFGDEPAILDHVAKKDLHKLGTEEDRRTRIERPRIDNSETQGLTLQARRTVYAERYAITSDKAEAFIKPTSLVLTINTFSSQLKDFPTFDVYKIFVPDMLHEFELGTWKGLFIHLIRMVNTRGAAVVAMLNRRVRSIPNFPPTAIRHFPTDISEMRHLAAHDYEDLLQCSIPCFEGIFSGQHDTDVRVIIFTMAQWHALGKLRMHTSSTIKSLDDHTTVLGRRMRRFQKSTAAAFKTVETNQEFQARQRRHERAALAAGSTSVAPLERKVKTLSLNTFKFHSQGDYSSAVVRLGATDNWTTQNTELEHKRSKTYARRTNQIQLTQGVVTLERREAKLQERHDALEALHGSERYSNHQSSTQTAGSEAVTGNTHYQVGVRGTTVRFIDFFHERESDPAVVNFMVDLQNHVLDRLRNPNDTGIRDLHFSDLDRRTISFTSGAMYSHATFRIEYTSYDVRRSYDIINPRFKHHFIMMLSGDDNPDHPFWYARVLGIYHVDVLWHSEGASTTRRMDFLWVRWMELIQPGSWDRCMLDRVRYMPENSYRDPYGFLDPACVIRACHMIPAYHYGQTDSPGSASNDAESDNWVSYYVNRFVDRDMFMRYWGGGVGHGTGLGNENVVDAGMSGLNIDEEGSDGADEDEGEYEYHEEEESLSDGSTSFGSDGEDQGIEEYEQLEGSF
ncbi:hypothetical protein FRC09_003185 [Ceratobasidium sp. 395]|nr:hypothetical protein FRC09_003185 [Ceratobasidium sp. 395]